MIEYTLNMGELAVAQAKNVTYKCLGLGSCVGLFLHDRTTGITGGAHIMLPDDVATPFVYGNYCTAGTAINELLTRFKRLGSNLQYLRAKIAGGANVLDAHSEMGNRNIQAVLHHLMHNKVFVAARDLGGMQSRTVRFYSDTATLFVHITKTQECKIY
jgi:chemotaxis protein CheD